jgi:hypothetical protein
VQPNPPGPYGNYPPPGNNYPPPGNNVPPPGGNFPPPGNNFPPPGGTYPPPSVPVPPSGYQLPSAPPVQLPPDPGVAPVDSALRLVITLLLTNLGLSIVLTVLTFVFRDSIVDYQLAHTHLPPNADISRVRSVLQQAVWTRVAGVIVVSLVYLWLVHRLRRGHRRAYLRVIWLSAAGIVGVGYLILLGQYPVWMRVEQALQALVLATLLWAVTRKEVRYRFAKPRLDG